MGLVDLHAHSSASDGADSPSELVSLAAGKGLSAVALTDHDTVSGLSEFLAAAAGTELRAVPGVEISVGLCSKELHMVGLFIDPGCESLASLLREIRSGRDSRNHVMIEKLNAMGCKLSLEEVLAIAPGESVGRPHFARVLVEKGYFKTHQEAFERCLKRGCSAYSQRALPSPETAIGAIHAAGGLAIWAHPVYRQPGERAFVRRMLRKLVPLGLDGMEAYYSLFSEGQRETLLQLAMEFGILVSGGSDYHGRNQPGIELGSGCGELKVPEEVFDALLAAWESRIAEPGRLSSEGHRPEAFAPAQP